MEGTSGAVVGYTAMEAGNSIIGYFSWLRGWEGKEREVLGVLDGGVGY